MQSAQIIIAGKIPQKIGLKHASIHLREKKVIVKSGFSARDKARISVTMRRSVSTSYLVVKGFIKTAVFREHFFSWTCSRSL